MRTFKVITIKATLFTLGASSSDCRVSYLWLFIILIFNFCPLLSAVGLPPRFISLTPCEQTISSMLFIQFELRTPLEQLHWIVVILYLKIQIKDRQVRIFRIRRIQT